MSQPLNLPGWLAWRANVKGSGARGWKRHVPAQLSVAAPDAVAEPPAANRPDFDVVRRYVRR